MVGDSVLSLVWGYWRLGISRLGLLRCSWSLYWARGEAAGVSNWVDGGRAKVAGTGAWRFAEVDRLRLCWTGLEEAAEAEASEAADVLILVSASSS